MAKFHSSLKIDKNTRIAVLCGGLSSEREVSLRSGKNCYEALIRLGYKNTEMLDVDKNIAQVLIDKNIEIAYITLHGKYGEDGCIQGLLEILGIPYTGCGVKTSSVAMDKEFTKKILKTEDIPVIPSIVINDFEKIKSKKICLNYPLMIKPVSEGSSIGMTKVSNEKELDIAIKEAQKYTKKVMLEEFIEGKSITVGILNINNDTIATPILEFKTKTEWYDFEAKYTDGLTEFILPAKLDADLTKEIQDISIKTHQLLEAQGMSRVDFIVTKDNQFFVLEINTIPGMTDLSDLPAQAKAMNINYDELVEIILNSAALNKN